MRLLSILIAPDERDKGNYCGGVVYLNRFGREVVKFSGFPMDKIGYAVDEAVKQMVKNCEEEI